MRYKNIFVKQHNTIKETLEIIDKNAKQIAIVIDENKKLLGTITDGDIRRAILSGANLNDTIVNIYNKNPLYAMIDEDREKLRTICLKRKIHQIPIVNSKKEVIDIYVLEDLFKKKSYPNRVVLMVGGVGSRLRPLTYKTPKPLLKIGDKPIIEIIIENFSKYGFDHFILSLNYKAEEFVQYLCHGERLGVDIEYVKEEKKLGTAGALSLMKDKLNGDFFVMNGDLLTTLNFENLLKFHQENNSIATMCVREYQMQIPFGVVEMEEDYRIKNVKEKPIYKHFVSAGIYMLNEKVLDYVPYNKYLDMPDLFKKLINENGKIVSFPIREYWLDIGRLKDYQRANVECKEIFDV